MDCHDWNLILMLHLQRFGRRSEPTKLETPCFCYQFLCLVCTTWTQVSGDLFLVPETWAENLGRVPSISDGVVMCNKVALPTHMFVVCTRACGTCVCVFVSVDR